MEEHGDNDYLESDICKRLLKELHALGYDAELITLEDKHLINLSELRMLTEHISYIKIKGMAFDYIQILTRG